MKYEFNYKRQLYREKLKFEYSKFILKHLSLFVSIKKARIITLHLLPYIITNFLFFELCKSKDETPIVFDTIEKNVIYHKTMNHFGNFKLQQANKDIDFDSTFTLNYCKYGEVQPVIFKRYISNYETDDYGVNKLNELFENITTNNHLLTDLFGEPNVYFEETNNIGHDYICDYLVASFMIEGTNNFHTAFESEANNLDSTMIHLFLSCTISGITFFFISNIKLNNENTSLKDKLKKANVYYEEEYRNSENALDVVNSNINYLERKENSNVRFRK